MKARYRLKKHANNDFTAITGIRAFQVNGGSNCLVVDHQTVRGGVNVQRYAYSIYNPSINTSRHVHITSSCGATNCVNRSHLIATYTPSKADKEYIRTYLSSLGKEQLAHSLGVPLSLFDTYLQSIV